MIATLNWYLIVSLLGLAAWPLAFRMLPGLKDRGYAISRALGLLLAGYVFWLLGSLGLLQNTVGGILLSALLVMGVSIAVYRARSDKQESLLGWARSHLFYIGIAEGLFLVAFVTWVVVRAYNPELTTTEKPMELAFLNGVNHSPVFPPLDPWLSGYSISYYYFGYVLMGLLAKLAGTPVSIAFNVGIALLFALTLLNSYGLVYNLAAGADKPLLPSITALLGPLFVGVAGNLEGFLELLRALNLPFVGPRFWQWLDIEDLTNPVTATFTSPDAWRFWWWWRASRVIRDRDIAGVASGLQPIDEFPMFSFLLGDMHPHVLALPFVLVALSLAYNALAQREPLSKQQLALYTVCFGGLAFLNTWDLPIYLFILVAALVIKQARTDGRIVLRNLWQPVAAGVLILGLGIAAYITWYIGFTSQLGGILPNAIYPTRLHQFIVMFGPFLVIIVWFLVDRAWALRGKLNWGIAALGGVGLLLALVAAMSVLGLRALASDATVRTIALNSLGINAQGLSGEQTAALVPDVIETILDYRLSHPLTPLFLTVVIMAALAVLFARPADSDNNSPPDARFSAPTGFVLTLILVGAMLTLGPEFVYLRDNFGQRLNTIFKFYYAAWLLFAVASAYAVTVLLRQKNLVLWLGFVIILVVLIAAALVYPTLAIPSKVGFFIRSATDAPPTLDGIDYIRRTQPSDYRGILWLQNNAEPGSIVLEAVGGAYNPNFGRISGTTGIPTLIGWANHEQQWRGPLFDQFAGGREGIVREIYNTTNIDRAQELLQENHVTYVFVGSSERNPAFASAAGLQKFDRFLTPVFKDGDTVIYSVDQPLVEGAK